MVPTYKANLNTLRGFLKKFATEKACYNHLKRMRMKSGFGCPRCGCQRIYEFSDKIRFKCSQCKHLFNAKAGTIFENSKLPLSKWFAALYLLTNWKKGVSSIQLADQLGVTQKTAWFMTHRIRSIYQNDMYRLSGIVEIDDTYIGGQEKYKHKSKKTPHTQGRSLKTKSVIVGLAERKGPVAGRVATDVTRKTVREILDNHSQYMELYSDEHYGYRLLSDAKVNHRLGEYARGNVHTNTIEGFWSYLKRGLNGIYHAVSQKHLQRYVDEYSFRYNHRAKRSMERIDFCLNRIMGTVLGYRQLVRGTGRMAGSSA